ncbi:MAG: hypothetical protein GXO21_06175 [Aquificae bacterium]|nr:hypothetical protein [Aquificota bacterium]
MKIAFPSKDGIHIWGHPGRAEYIVVITVDKNKILKKEIFENTIKHHEKGEKKLPKNLTESRNNPTSQNPAQKKLWDILKNVDLFVTKRCGEGFKRNLEYIGVPLVLTKEKDVETFLKEYFAEV